MLNKLRPVFRSGICLILLMLAGCIDSRPDDGQTAGQRPFPLIEARNIDQVDFPEPSGIVFHPGRQTIFVVGDEGDIGEMTTEGALIKQAHLRGADFEGITVDPATGLLYVAVEGEEKILEVDPETFIIRREFLIQRYYGERLLLKPGGQGIEAITFVPEATHLEGGTFFLTNQSLSLDDTADPSVVLEVEVPLRSLPEAVKVAEARIIRYFSIGFVDLSGLFYDPGLDQLYVISDAADTMLLVTREGELRQQFHPLPGEDQEGITVDDRGFLYIVQDSGGILQVTWKREP